MPFMDLLLWKKRTADTRLDGAEVLLSKQTAFNFDWKRFLQMPGNLWRVLARQKAIAKRSLYFIAVSGFVLWAPLNLPWAVARHVLFWHIAASLMVFPLFVMPFWLHHRARMNALKGTLQWWVGAVIEWLLVLEVVSGIWLAFWGNPGNPPGQASRWIHFVGGFPFALLILFHVLWKPRRRRKRGGARAAVK